MASPCLHAMLVAQADHMNTASGKTTYIFIKASRHKEAFSKDGPFFREGPVLISNNLTYPLMGSPTAECLATQLDRCLFLLPA